MTRIEFDAVLEFDAAAGTAEALIVPFGIETSKLGQSYRFGPGEISFASITPVSIDHGDGVLERVGVARCVELADGLYGSIAFSDTVAGRDTATLCRDGALTDVSAGIAMGAAPPYDLDHVSIVQHGAFGPAGSKILQIHQAETEETNMTELSEEMAPHMAEFSTAMTEMRQAIAELSNSGAPAEELDRHPAFTDLRDFVLTLNAASQGDAEASTRMTEFVLDDDTTTTAAGLVPAFLSTQIIGIIDTMRPYISSIQSDPIGDQGMAINYPRRTTQPSVAAQAVQKTEVSSTATEFDTVSVPLVTYAGASDVALQLIERSAPSFVERLFLEYAGIYAEVTDAAVIAAHVALAGDTAIVANLGTAADATWAAVADASAAVAAGMRRPADTMCVSVDRWAQLMTLTDSDGRPLIVPTVNNPRNSQGGGGFSTFTFNYGGLNGIVDPNAAAGTCMIYNSEYAATMEQSPIQLRALQVGVLGMDMGVYGLLGNLVKYPDGLSTITVA